MFDIVTEFENRIANFFGAPYAVSTDCCTHAVELCLRYNKSNNISIPTHTYLSIPMTAEKLNLNWNWNNEPWADYYYLDSTVVDAAVLWKRNSYIPNTLMCVSFQFKKHLSLGRGGVILLDDKQAYADLIKLGYDGRERGISWPEQDVKINGFHYYMTPETAQLGIDKLDHAISTTPKYWTWKDYPNLKDMSVFNRR
jgi:dTDP-4-amino-4,6-dideoxygalactose transaminase